MAARTTNLVDLGDVDSFNPWPDAQALTLQRVWDTGTAGWCYYKKNVIDPTPLAAETTPNYTGAISAHSIVIQE